MSKLAKTRKAPSPKGAAHRRIKLPPTWEGIQFMIARMSQNIQDQYADPVIVDSARQIAARWCRFVEDESRRQGEEVNCFASQIIQLEGLFVWSKHHAVYVNDPVDKEVIQTPNRLYRQTKLSREFIEWIMEPFYSELEEASVGFDRSLYQSPPMFIGDCDELLQLCLSWAAALGMRPIKFRFGATGDKIHHVWGVVVADGEEFAIDLTERHNNLGEVGEYQYTENFVVLGDEDED